MKTKIASLSYACVCVFVRINDDVEKIKYYHYLSRIVPSKSSIITSADVISTTPILHTYIRMYIPTMIPSKQRERFTIVPESKL